MQLRQALRVAIAQLESAKIEQARLHAEVLLMHVLGCDRAYLFAHPERELTSDEQTQYEQLIRRRAAGEPLQYLTGHQEFWKADFVVTPAVLIPRPETEHLIEAVLALVRASHLSRRKRGEGGAPSGEGGGPGPRLKIIDVGTGSGAIAVTLARELPQAEVHAADVSPEALEIARRNAERLGAQVHFAQSDLLTSVARDASFDFVVSNPPYVAESEPEAVQEVVRRHEPPLALFAGDDGLDVIRRLIPQAREALRPGGWLVFEIGYAQWEPVRTLLHPNTPAEGALGMPLTGWEDVHCASDLAGIPRVVIARKPR